MSRHYGALDGCEEEIGTDTKVDGDEGKLDDDDKPQPPTLVIGECQRSEGDSDKNGPNNPVLLMPAEVWAEVLGWIGRMEMAQKWSLICRWLNALCHARLHGAKQGRHVVQYLHFDFGGAEEKNRLPRAMLRIKRSSGWMFESVPIASTPPPDYIHGFRNIRISHLDDQLLSFMGLIVPRLTHIRLHIYGHHLLPIRRLFQLLHDQIGVQFYFEHPKAFADALRCFPTIIGRAQMLAINLEQMPTLWIGSLLQLLVEEKSDDDKGRHGPRMLKIYYQKVEFVNALIDAIKENFLAAVQHHQQSSFYIAIVDFTWSGAPLDPFEMANPVTGETLALYPVNGNNNNYALYRHAGANNENADENANVEWRAKMANKMAAIKEEEHDWGGNSGESASKSTSIVVEIREKPRQQIQCPANGMG